MHVLHVLVLAAQAVAQLDVDDLFQVNYQTTYLGSCLWVGRDKLNRMIEDSLYLARKGSELIRDYDNPAYPEARRLVDGFFKPQHYGDLVELRGTVFPF